MSIIPLAKAYLCLDCDSIGDDFAFCPACGSLALMLLANLLGTMHDERQKVGES